MSDPILKLVKFGYAVNVEFSRENKLHPVIAKVNSSASKEQEFSSQNYYQMCLYYM